MAAAWTVRNCPPACPLSQNPRPPPQNKKTDRRKWRPISFAKIQNSAAPEQKNSSLRSLHVSRTSPKPRPVLQPRLSFGHNIVNSRLHWRLEREKRKTTAQTKVLREEESRESRLQRPAADPPPPAGALAPWARRASSPRSVLQGARQTASQPCPSRHSPLTLPIDPDAQDPAGCGCWYLQDKISCRGKLVGTE